MNKKLLCFSGSAAKRSRHGNLCQVVSTICSSFYKDLEVTCINLKDYPIPIYNVDLYDLYGIPNNVRIFVNLFNQNDFIFIAAPEYNSSVTPVLKNMIDWMSKYRRFFVGKPIAIASVSYTSKKENKVLHHLQDILLSLKMNVIQSKFYMNIKEFDSYKILDFNKIKGSILCYGLTKVLEDHHHHLRGDPSDLP